jgi:hypothetical protein
MVLLYMMVAEYVAFLYVNALFVIAKDFFHVASLISGPLELSA